MSKPPKLDPPSLYDPPDEAAWQAHRAEAHALLDALYDKLQRANEGRVWTPVPAPVKKRLAGPAPAEGQDIGRVIAELGETILPYATGNTHPRFWGWVHGTGTPGGMLAEMVAGALNANCGGRDHGAIYVERAVIAWAARWFGLPREAGGVLVTGSSMANIVGIAVGRHHKGGRDVRRTGNGPDLVAYASTEMHASLVKGFDFLGLGRDSLRAIPVDEAFEMRVDRLEAAILADKAAGKRPFCVVATAGTVNTGAFDDLEAIEAVCRRHDLWFHVDGAFGGLAVLDPGLRPKVRGIKRADSLAFDYHKWLHVPYSAGMVLVRDAALQLAVFGGRPDYLADGAGLSAGAPWPTDFGVDLSRGFQALKIWWLVKEHGTRKMGRAIARNCAQALKLGGLLTKNPHIRLTSPIALNIVTARYEVAGMSDEELDRLNARITAAMQESGEAVFSTCRLAGRLCMRFCLTNHRTRNADLELAAKAVGRLGAELATNAKH